MSNMDIYNAFRITPKEALKPITEGKLKGKSDINPMWRLQMLTEQFGPVGFGWNFKVTRMEALPVPERNEIMCFVDIEMKVKVDGEWSEPIFGTGGSMLVENYRSAGIKSNDDGYKMALTDAISIACKHLGMSADVYWAAGETKYNRNEPENAQAETKNKQQEPQKAADEQPQPKPRPERVKALCAHHGVKMSVFGDVLKALQDDGKLPRVTTQQMTDEDFNVALSLVHKALQHTIKESA